MRLELRAGDATASGAIDGWIIIQILSISLVAIFFAKHLLSSPKQLRRIILLRKTSALNIGLLITSIGALASTAWSPQPWITLTYSCLLISGYIFFIGVQQLISKLNHAEIFELLLKTVVVSNLTILSLILTVAFVSPEAVMSISETGEIRILGGAVGSLPLTGFNLFASALIWLSLRRDQAIAPMTLICIGLICIFYARTRSSYIGVIIISMIALSLLWRSRTNITLRMTATIFGGGAIAALLYDAESIIKLLTKYDQTSGDIYSITSGRAYIFEWSIDRILENPLGFGYISGFRSMFMSLPDDFFIGLIASRIGNAHNSYIEMAFGAGLIPGLAFTFAIAWITLKVAILSQRASHPSYKLFFGMLLSYAIFMLFASDFAIPTRQAHAHFLLLLAVAASILTIDKAQTKEKRNA